MSEYPSDEELDKIRKWQPDDMSWEGLFSFIKTIWWQPSWGWTRRKRDGRAYYHISTGGWSGNEEIISAMCDNNLMWICCWRISRSGGHYIFRVEL